MATTIKNDNTRRFGTAGSDPFLTTEVFGFGYHYSLGPGMSVGIADNGVAVRLVASDNASLVRNTDSRERDVGSSGVENSLT